MMKRSIHAATHPHARFWTASRNETHRELVYRPFELEKCSQLFVGAHDETLSVAMRVGNP